MRSERFNQDWEVMDGIVDPFAVLYAGGPKAREVTLPQDAMIWEERSADCPSATQSGFYPAKTYTYRKRFLAPREWEEGCQFLEFEGVMGKTNVYVNNQFAGSHPYGYSQFYVDLCPCLKYGEENEIRVVCSNTEQASRWYPGSGIYRDVNLHTGGSVYIMPESLRLTTEYIEPEYAVVRVDMRLVTMLNRMRETVVRVWLCDGAGEPVSQGEAVVTLAGGPGAETEASLRMTVSEPKLWSPDSPVLYSCRVEVTAEGRRMDTAEEEFGIRTLRLDARGGLRINGKTVKLKGCCIHHDNGIIGATTLYQAEEFRVRNLKEAGFNSIRSSHNPMGKTMLRVCDRLGMLVMDELGDMWNVPKNCNDYSFAFQDQWKAEVGRMVSKDYNHPCVVLYSCGNEIPEIGQPYGRALCRSINNAFRELDATRYTTGGINGLLAVGDRLAEYMTGLGMGGAQPASDEAQPASGGSEALNAAMAELQKARMDAFAVSGLLTEALEEASCAMDVTGLNYLTARHELENASHPDRIVVGSETYPGEIADLWEIVEKNPHVIGDFTWTGYDYLGEAGIGIFHYEGDRKKQGYYPDRLAYCGDINLNGYRRPASYLRQIAYGERKEPFLAVERPERYGQSYDRNGWKYCDGLDSWTYEGFEGKPVRVRVLARADEVELFLNGVSKGRKRVGEAEKLTAFFDCTYEPGELKAVSYTDGKEIGSSSLVTAGEPVALKVEVVNEKLSADGSGVSFLIIEPVDEKGNVNRQIRKKVSVSVEGPGVLAGFGSANPTSEDSYQTDCGETFDGRIMAAIRSTARPGRIAVTLSAEGCGVRSVEIVSS